MKKRFITLLMSVTLASSTCMTSFAGEWKWQDIDGNDIAECYYYDDEFYNRCDEEFKKAMHFWNMTNVNKTIRTTPDGYQINAARQWIVDGVVQTQNVEIEKPAIHTQIPYDPAHPLARVVDAWNLRLVETNFEDGKMGTIDTIYSWNVHAMLTNQMDKYNDPIVKFKVPLIDGMYIFTDEVGNRIYMSEEDYLNGKKEAQFFYDWFCNWLNGMDFENMSEMDKAKEIQKIMAPVVWQSAGNHTGDTFRHVLIEKRGSCAECAMTVMSLAKALGLKSAISGTGDHAVYYIQVDGVGYFGQDNVLNLDNPTPDFVSFQ